MKKYQKLKKAYDFYPKGTIFLQLSSGKKIESSGIFKISQGDGCFGVCDEENNNAVYSSHINKWAEIVSFTTVCGINIVAVDYDPTKITINKKPLLVSEDGISLYEDDECYIVKIRDGNWCLDEHSDKGDQSMFKIADNGNFFNNDVKKVFSTKQSAEAWIAKQNKPKIKYIEIPIKEHGLIDAVVHKEHITLNKKYGGSYNISIEELQAIMNALIELKTLSK